MTIKITESLRMQERAQKRIPGMTQLLSKRPDQFSEGVWPAYYSKAKGCEIRDLDGNRYIDMSIGGIGANVLGYADPDVDQAVRSAIENGNSSSLNCPEEVDLADLLCELHPWAEKVRFARTGGESMAIAVRIARAFTGKDKIAFCGYHGWHDWYLSTNLGTDNALGGHLLPGLESAGVPQGLKGTTFPFRYNRLDEFEAIIDKHGNELAAVVMEPIRNDWPKPGFLETIRRKTSEIGAVFIMDEISSGFRLACGGAHLVLGVNPDIAVFSKALGNGYPIAAIIGRAGAMEAAQKTFISSTCWTERIGPAAAIATIHKYRRLNLERHLNLIGESVQAGWKELGQKHKLPLDVGGLPALSHFRFQSEQHPSLKALFIQLMMDSGFLSSSLCYAMGAHTTDHVRDYLKAADHAFATISELEKSGKVGEALKGKPAAEGFKRLV